jgi:hypothetical protein
MEINKTDFEYLLLSPKITVLGDYKNEDYLQKVQNNLKNIEKAWEDEQARRNKKLFNGNILNLAVINNTQSQELILSCHPVEYKHYLAQRSGIDLGITPLAVSGIVFYKEDNKEIFLVGKRSETVTQYPGYYEFMPSGSIDANNIVVAEPMEYKKQLLIELKEECGITDEVKTINSFCLIFDEVDRVYDIGIEIEIDIDHKTQIQEYTSIEKMPLDLVSEYMKKQNVVITSRRLFEAWKCSRSVESGLKT